MMTSENPSEKPAGEKAGLQTAVSLAAILSALCALVTVIHLLNGTPAQPEQFASHPSELPSGRNQMVPAALPIETGPVAAHEPAQSDSQARCPRSPGQLYVFPDSGTRILRPEELQSLPTYKLRIARNEIFARHGQRFYSDMKTYFACEPWYRATTDNVSNELSPVEHANIASIFRAEHRQ